MHWIFWIIAILLSAGGGYWVYIADKRRAVPYPWITSLMRAGLLFLTLLLLLAPNFTIHKNVTQKPVVLLLQDNSRSIATAIGKDSAEYRKHVEELANKLSGKYQVIQWGFGNTIQPGHLFDYRQQATDMSATLQRAGEFLGQQNPGAVILATDGRFNQGANPLIQPVALPGILYTVAIGDSAIQKDIRITKTYANKTVSLNNQFEIRADMVAMLSKGYNDRAILTEDGSQVGTAPVSITTDRYDRSVAFTIKATKAGMHHYTITIPAAEGEKNTANNRKDIFVEVTDEKKNILIAASAPHPDINAIKDALSGMENYTVTVKTGENIPTSFSNYQVIILHGLPDHFTNILPQLQNSKKPVWYILGPQTSNTVMNELQNGIKLNINPAGIADIQPVLNPAFTAFNLPQTLQAVLDKMPPLSVPMGTYQPAPNTYILLNQRNNGATQPLWVMQQGGAPMAMLMGQGIWRWRLYEFKYYNKHDVIDDCIRQTVAFLSSNNNEKPFTVSLPKYVWSDQEPVNVNAWLLNANNEQVNTPDVTFNITDSAGHKQAFSFDRHGNSYQLNIGVWAGGTYLYTATTNYNGRPYTAQGSFVIENTPLELMETGADYPLLYGLAKKYNGSLVPASNIASLYDSIIQNNNIKPVIQTDTETISLVNWKWYFFLLISLAVGEWLLRKYWMAQ